MKKILALVLVLFMGSGFFIQSSNAQEFAKGDKVLNVGLGLGTALYSGSYYKMSIPPISASFEVGVKDDVGPGNIGIGGYFGIAGSKYEGYGWDGTGWKYTYIVIGARGSYHFHDIADKLDLYAGLMPYYAVVSAKAYGDGADQLNNYFKASSSFMSISLFGGARYYFTEKFAGMAELGWGVSYLNLGVAFKL